MLTVIAITLFLLLLLCLLITVQRGVDKLDKAVGIFNRQVQTLETQNANLISIREHLSTAGTPRMYVAPTVPFCDHCRKEFPPSNRWWTLYQHGYPPFKLCAYPQQKERPEDKWLHGEECIVAELTNY